MSNEVYNPSRRDFLKRVLLGTGGYVFGSMLIHPDETLAQSIEGYLETVPMEVRWEIAAVNALLASISSCKANYDIGGRDRFVELTKRKGPVSGAQLKRLADMLGFTGNDAKSMAAIMPALMILFSGPEQKYEIEEAVAEKARVKGINCAFWNAAQKMEVTDDICSPSCQYTLDGLAKALNPKLTLTLAKARPRGDPVCEWIIELKA